MNIIIPIGGKGERFKNEGYTTPKVLIPVLGQEIIFWVLDRLCIDVENTITIIYNNELENCGLESRIRNRYNKYNFNFIKMPHQSNGPIETILYGLNRLTEDQLDETLLIHDGDSFVKTSILDKVKPGEHKIFYTINDNPKPLFSYITLNDDKVTKIREKEKISDNANIGCYQFSSGRFFKDWATEISPAGYISEVYRIMLMGKEVVLSEKIEPDDFVCLGTPAQIIQFSSKTKQLPKRFCFDLDNTLVSYPVDSGDYSTVTPIEKNIKFLKSLHQSGHYIIIYTARRMKTHGSNVSKVIQDIGKITLDTLEKFEIPYDEICFGKPYADFYIDDLAVNIHEDVEKQTGFYINSVEPRHFNRVEFTDKTVIKRSDKDLSGEINFYKQCPNELKKYFPTLIRSTETELETEKIEGNLVSKMYCNSSLHECHIDTLFNVLNAIQSCKFFDMVDIYENYSNKLVSRYNTYDYSRFVNSKKTFDKINEKLIEYQLRKLGWMSVIHGDFVFSNIFINPKDEVKLIDMRGKLGDKLTICGDINYDYAKFYQSLIGYDFILNDRYPPMMYSKKCIDYFESKYKKLYGEEQLEYLKYITASLLFTLIPLHNNNKCQSYYNLIEYLI